MSNLSENEKIVVDILMTSIRSLKLSNEEIFTIALGFLTQVINKMDLDDENIEKVCGFIKRSVKN